MGNSCTTSQRQTPVFTSTQYKQKSNLFARNLKTDPAKKTKKITLDNNKLGEDVKYLAARQWSSGLTDLNLRNNEITSQHFELISYGEWDRLTVLELSNNQIGDKGIYYIPRFPVLKELFLQKNQITDKGAIKMSQFVFSHLSVLYLGQNQIGDKGFQALFALIALTKLSIWKNKITHKGVKALTTKTYFDEFCQIDISLNPIGTIGQEMASSFEWIDNLQVIYK